ncbi:hypothetical protein EPI10_027861 [Gossypium australe]|uniref:Uncharacterized protein n=1 Tax=Gossypium australe TaxID=47621 RepID=A0A5B6UT94_9ROSI|nr:hypothetical protein EPI10_027861 [Gossypium australe]
MGLRAPFRRPLEGRATSSSSPLARFRHRRKGGSDDGRAPIMVMGCADTDGGQWRFSRLGD